MYARFSGRQDRFQSLYRALLVDSAHFDEFKRLLGLYTPTWLRSDSESSEAAYVRACLNARIADWVGDRHFVGLTASEVHKWRVIVVEETGPVAVAQQDVLSAW